MGAIMRKDLACVLVSILHASLGFTLFILISCGGGGGGGSSTPAPPTDNFGSIMSTGPIMEREYYDEEFWTKERIEEAIKNPIDIKSDILPMDKTIRQIPEGVQESLLPYNPDAENESMVSKKRLFSKYDQTYVSREATSCPPSSYQIYSTLLFLKQKQQLVCVLLHSSIRV
jgi:hypothetical protein